MLAHADRTRLLDEQHRPRVVTKNLRVKATFLIDGRVAGTWKSERKGKKATLTLEPFGKLRKKDVAALQREGEALLRFVEQDAAASTCAGPEARRSERHSRCVCARVENGSDKGWVRASGALYALWHGQCSIQRR